MKDEALLTILEETAERLSVKITYDDLRKGVVNTPGGSYILKGEKNILIHKGLETSEKVDLLFSLLSSYDTEALHLPPEVRTRLESAQKAV